MRVCLWCGQPFDSAGRPGQAPLYCRRSHRQRAYEARRSSGRAGATRLQSRAGTALCIRLLGRLGLFAADGSEIRLGPGSRGVLAALAMRPRQVVGVERLVDRVWPDVEEAVARRRLHTAVWRLRTLVAHDAAGQGQEVIAWVSNGYSLNVSWQQLDWERFVRLHEAGERALKRRTPHVAKSYLKAALSLWEGPEPLSDIDVPSDDVGFTAELKARRERALATLVEARLAAGESGELLPELEGRFARDSGYAEPALQLATAHYRSAHPGRALDVCRRYLEAVARAGGEPSAAVTSLQAAILQGEPASPALAADGEAQPLPRVALMAVAWAPYVASAAAPLPADLQLLAEDCGGEVTDATEFSFEASFADLRAAADAAVVVQAAAGEPPLVRVGVDHRPYDPRAAGFDELRRARARLLASAAREGQVLLTGVDAAINPLLPAGARLHDLGTHRLNSLTPPVPTCRLTAPGMIDVVEPPAWFDSNPVRNLAVDPFRFFGRAREIADVERLLAHGGLVTLTGPPGSGKTRLAAHIATGTAREYRDGAWFVSLESVFDAAQVPSAVAGVLVSSAAGRRPAVEAIERELRDRHALLVLDNCEHVHVACRELVERLLAVCSNVTVLATSREPLHSRLERVVSIPPLATPPSPPSDASLTNPAVQLFYDRLGRPPDRRAATRSREIHAVTRICATVEGIPLALVFAAGRARELGVQALADLLEDTLGQGSGLTILSPEGRDDEATRQTLQGTMEWSYRLLRDTDRHIFESLSVFRTSFPLESAVAVCHREDGASRDDVIAAVGRLVEVSLVTYSADRSGTGRYRVLQPVRDFAAAKLRMHDRSDLVNRRHAQHFLALAEEAEAHLRGPQDVATLDRIEASLPDLHAAIGSMISDGVTSMALRTVGALWVFWLVRGRLPEGLRLVEAALAADRSLSPERIKALIACSHLAWFGGDLTRARKVLQEALTIAEATGDKWGYAWATLGLAAVKMFAASDATIPLRIEEVVPLFRELGNDWDTGQALQTLGGAAWHRGEYERAERALAESTALYRSLGHPTLMASLLAHGLVLALLGRSEEGAAEVDRSVVAAYEAGDVANLSYALCHKAAISRYRGQHDEARRYYRDALRTARDAASGWAILWALDGLADTEQLGLHGLTERLRRSVMLLASAEALSRQTAILLAPREREHHARDVRRARERLGQREFDDAFAAGTRLTLDEAIEMGLAEDDGLPR